MTLYSSILGIPIICSKGNMKIGIVREVSFCSKQNTIMGLIVQDKGVFSPAKCIPFECIKEVNETNIMTDSLDCIVNVKKTENVCEQLTIENNPSINTFVYFKNGTLVGQIKDILFDFKKNSIEEFIISKSYFEDVYSNREVLDNEIENIANSSNFTILNY